MCPTSCKIKINIVDCCILMLYCTSLKISIVYVNIKRCPHFRSVTRRDAQTRKPPPPCPPWPPPGAGPGRQQPPSPCSLLQHQPPPRQDAELRAPRAPAREQRAMDPGIHREVPRTLGGQEKQTDVPVQEEGNVGEWASIRYTCRTYFISFYSY